MEERERAEHMIYQGLWSAEYAREQTGLDLDVEPCGHRTRRYMLIVERCDDCGRTWDRPISDQILEAATLVRQGKIPKRFALQSYPLDPAERALLEMIEPCRHLFGNWTTCCGGSKRWECKDCGRRWDQKPEQSSDLT